MNREAKTSKRELLIFAYEVALPPEAATARLEAAIGEVPRSYHGLPGLHGGRRHVGRVWSGGFDVHVRQKNYNSLAPRAFGRIEPTARGCRVSCRIDVPRPTRVGLALLMVAPPSAASLFFPQSAMKPGLSRPSRCSR